MDLNWLQLPNISEDSLADAAERRKILESLYALNEQLKYALMNLDESNFTDEFKETLDMTSDVAALTQRVEDAEAGVVSVRKQTAEGFSQTVKKDQIISAINQSAELVQILANKINLNGYVSINGAFSVDENGYLHAQNGGQIGNWLITSNGLLSANGSVALNGQSGAITGSAISGGSITGTAISGGTIAGSTVVGGSIMGASGYFSGILGSQNNGWTFDGYNCSLLQNGVPTVTLNGSTITLSGGYSTIGYGNSHVMNSQFRFGNNVVECQGQFRPMYSMTYTCGSPNYLWSDIYALSGAVNTSDRNRKNSIAGLDGELCEAFLAALKPVSFKMNEGTSGRTHFGLIAQDVEEAMAAVGLTGEDFAGLVKAPASAAQPGPGAPGGQARTAGHQDAGSQDAGHQDAGSQDAGSQDGGGPGGGMFYGLRYDEFLAPLIKVVQRQGERIQALEEALRGLFDRAAS